MTPKKIIQTLMDQTLSRQERLFRLLVVLGLVGLAMAMVGGFFVGENIENQIAMAIAFIVLLGSTYLSIHYKKIQFGSSLVAVIIVYVIVPYNFITTGGLYGGAPIWCMFGIVYVSLVVENKIKYVFIISELFLCAGCYYFAYTHPEKIIMHSMETFYLDSFLSLVIVSMLTCTMILFQNAIFRKENEVARQQKDAIEELNNMQNRFFSNMSHEIRTPINTIIGLNEIILRETDSEEVAADARNIQNASKMLLTLINDILDMSKIESGKMDIVPVTYDVGAMLSDIVNMIWVKAKEKGLEFRIDVDQTMPAQLFGDEVRIKQVLINLLNNAVKYTTEGSVVLSIQCERKENGQAQVTYSVTDTGLGIKKENMEHLFSAFKRVDSEKNRYIEGTGLGLSIVKQLVELMGGTVAVNSIYTKGSTFVATIPQMTVSEARIGKLDMEKRHAMNMRKRYKQSFEAPNARILVVDDNETNLLVVKKLLKETRIQIDTAMSGAECLEKTLKVSYHLIFMDHLMPVMDGIECFHAIRAQAGGLNQDTAVVALTANAGGEQQSLYRREGFDGYLSKPISGRRLEEELLKYLSRELVEFTNLGTDADMAEASVLTDRKKIPIMISTESVCDLPKRLIEKFHIPVIPYRVITEGGEFLDNIETGTEGLLSYIGEQGKRAWSEEPDAADYRAFFAEQLTKAQSIIHITMAGNVAKGYENALEASQMFENVTVIDSGHLSSGMGLLLLRAANYAASGMTTDAIIEKIERMKTQVRTSFIVDSTEYLARVERISSKVNKICNALMIHPVLILRNSSMKVRSIQIGSRKYAWRKYINMILRSADKIDTHMLFITHAGLTNEELKEIEEAVKSKVAFENVIYQKASSAIVTNCGPGSFGLLFMVK